MQRFVRLLCGSIAVGILSVAGCAAVVPRELADARLAYRHASNSRAASLSPAELHNAKEALNVAEASWSHDPESNQTRDLAYVAQRRAQLAEAKGFTALAQQDTTRSAQAGRSRPGDRTR
jgi:uncharacterized protein DUF4398